MASKSIEPTTSALAARSDDKVDDEWLAIQNGVKKHAKEIKLFKKDGRPIVDRSGKIVVDAEAVKRISNGMMDASVLDFYLKEVLLGELEAQDKVAIFGVNFLRDMIDKRTSDETNKMFQRFEKRMEWNDLFRDAHQIHFPMLSGNHYSVISLEKVSDSSRDGEHRHNISTKCSFGRPMDEAVRKLLDAIRDYYKYKGKRFNDEQWHRPLGRGTKRCAKQGSNGLNCGLFVCFNIEMMVKIGATTPAFCNEDAMMYRDHIALSIQQFLDKNGDYSLMEERSDCGSGRRLKKMPRTQTQGKGSPSVIDLTED